MISQIFSIMPAYPFAFRNALQMQLKLPMSIILIMQSEFRSALGKSMNDKLTEAINSHATSNSIT